MARPTRILLTTAQLIAIDAKFKDTRASNRDLARRLNVSSETVRQWFSKSGLVQDCYQHLRATKGKELYPVDSELMVRRRAAQKQIPPGTDFSLHIDEWKARENQVELVYGKIPSLKNVWSSQQIAVTSLIVLEAVSGDFQTTAVWKYQHSFIIDEDADDQGDDDFEPADPDTFEISPKMTRDELIEFKQERTK